jgi:hypothetical protein
MRPVRIRQGWVSPVAPANTFFSVSGASKRLCREPEIPANRETPAAAQATRQLKHQAEKHDRKPDTTSIPQVLKSQCWIFQTAKNSDSDRNREIIGPGFEGDLRCSTNQCFSAFGTAASSAMSPSFRLEGKMDSDPRCPQTPDHGGSQLDD